MENFREKCHKYVTLANCHSCGRNFIINLTVE